MSSVGDKAILTIMAIGVTAALCLSILAVLMVGHNNRGIVDFIEQTEMEETATATDGSPISAEQADYLHRVFGEPDPSGLMYETADGQPGVKCWTEAEALVDIYKAKNEGMGRINYTHELDRTVDPPIRFMQMFHSRVNGAGMEFDVKSQKYLLCK